MTTIVAVRKNGRTCIVSDSLVTYGARRKEASETLLEPTSKLLLCKNAIVGFSGSSSWEHCLKQFIGSSKIDLGSCTSEVLRRTFSNFLEWLRSTWAFASTYESRFTSFSECQIVIARRDCLFEVAIEGCVIENRDVVVIGNGRPFAYGAIKALDPSIEASEELAIAGIRAAAAWDPNTLGPFYGWLISETATFTELGLPK